MSLYQKIQVWGREILHLFRRKIWTYQFIEPPAHYREQVTDGKVPVILIPGIGNKWSSVKDLGEELSLDGHPVYIVSELKNNTYPIADSAQMVRRVIEKEALACAVLVGHSRGGLIGKYYLMRHNADGCVKGVVAIGTPFSGTRLARLYASEAFKEMRIQSRVLSEMAQEVGVNDRIISIYPQYDTHVWSEEGCFLQGAARNIELPLAGHNMMMLHPDTFTCVLAAVDELSNR